MTQHWILPPDGQSLVDPPFSEWTAIAEKNRALASTWHFEVAGQPVSSLREIARRDVLAASDALSARLGVSVADIDPSKAGRGLLVMTGHQPALYHPGVWLKGFLLQRFADAANANAVDLVVDSDGFESISAPVPCLEPMVRRCRADLVAASPGGCYATTPVPDSESLEAFCAETEALLGGLPADGPRANFAEFARCLRSAAASAENAAELITIARRRFEREAGTRYRELAMTALARTPAFLAFAADIFLSAQRFADAYNAELDSYRASTRTRSAAQPFPNLGRREDRMESSFWLIADGVRSTIWVEELPSGGVRLLAADGVRTLDLPARGEKAQAALAASGWQLAPKALSLTLFVRVFCCDLFIHGTGGGRYDAVTDGVCRRYYSAEPPAFAVATLTLSLPIEIAHPEEAELSAARERLNRLEQNPDAFLSEVRFESAETRARAEALAAEKAALVEEIASPGADKKHLGQRIRQANSELAEIVAPAKAELAQRLATLETQREAWRIVSDRTYPFCYWSPTDLAREAARA